jgi:hypothetical protein
MIRDVRASGLFYLKSKNEEEKSSDFTFQL